MTRDILLFGVIHLMVHGRSSALTFATLAWPTVAPAFKSASLPTFPDSESHRSMSEPKLAAILLLPETSAGRWLREQRH